MVKSSYLLKIVTSVNVFFNTVKPDNDKEVVQAFFHKTMRVMIKNTLFLQVFFLLVWDFKRLKK